MNSFDSLEFFHYVLESRLTCEREKEFWLLQRNLHAKTIKNKWQKFSLIGIEKRVQKNEDQFNENVKLNASHEGTMLQSSHVANILIDEAIAKFFERHRVKSLLYCLRCMGEKSWLLTFLNNNKLSNLSLTPYVSMSSSIFQTFLFSRRHECAATSSKRERRKQIFSAKQGSSDSYSENFVFEENFDGERFLLVRRSCIDRVVEDDFDFVCSSANAFSKNQISVRKPWTVFDEKMREMPHFLTHGEMKMLDDVFYSAIVAAFSTWSGSAQEDSKSDDVSNTTLSELTKTLIARSFETRDEENFCEEADSRSENLKNSNSFAFRAAKEMNLVEENEARETNELNTMTNDELRRQIINAFIESEYPATFSQSKLESGNIIYYKGRPYGSYSYFPSTRNTKSAKNKKRVCIGDSNNFCCCNPCIVLDAKLVRLYKNCDDEIYNENDAAYFANERIPECETCSSSENENNVIKEKDDYNLEDSDLVCRRMYVADILRLGNVNTAQWPWIIRRSILESIVVVYPHVFSVEKERCSSSVFGKCIRLVPYKFFRSMNEVHKFIQECTARGSDGVLARHTNGRYVFGSANEKRKLSELASRVNASKGNLIRSLHDRCKILSKLKDTVLKKSKTMQNIRISRKYVNASEARLIPREAITNNSHTEGPKKNSPSDRCSGSVSTEASVSSTRYQAPKGASCEIVRLRRSNCSRVDARTITSTTSDELSRRAVDGASKDTTMYSRLWNAMEFEKRKTHDHTLINEWFILRHHLRIIVAILAAEVDVISPEEANLMKVFYGFVVAGDQYGEPDEPPKAICYFSTFAKDTPAVIAADVFKLLEDDRIVNASLSKKLPDGSNFSAEHDIYFKMRIPPTKNFFVVRDLLKTSVWEIEADANFLDESKHEDVLFAFRRKRKDLEPLDTTNFCHTRRML